jgi:uncharacterized protein with GYD domain
MFLMLGKYTTQGVKGASTTRTKKITDLLGRCGGRVDSMYGLMGGLDVAFLVDFPRSEEAIRASFELAKTTGIAFATHAAIPVAQFDRLISGKERPTRTRAARPTSLRRQVTVRAPRIG